MFVSAGVAPTSHSYLQCYALNAANGSPAAQAMVRALQRSEAAQQSGPEPGAKIEETAAANLFKVFG
jgi:hypothetical protein